MRVLRDPAAGVSPHPAPRSTRFVAKKYSAGATGNTCQYAATVFLPSGEFDAWDHCRPTLARRIVHLGESCCLLPYLQPPAKGKLNFYLKPA